MAARNGGSSGGGRAPRGQAAFDPGAKRAFVAKYEEWFYHGLVHGEFAIDLADAVAGLATDTLTGIESDMREFAHLMAVQFVQNLNFSDGDPTSEDDFQRLIQVAIREAVEQYGN